MKTVKGETKNKKKVDTTAAKAVFGTIGIHRLGMQKSPKVTEQTRKSCKGKHREFAGKSPIRREKGIYYY